MRPRSTVASALVIISVGGFAAAQSQLAPEFKRYEATGDRAELFRSISESHRNGVVYSTEINALTDIVESPSNADEANEARFWICNLSSDLVLSRPDDATIHAAERAARVFESRADGSGGDKWGVSAASLTAYTGIQPSQRVLALIYKMIDDPDERAQGVAIGALARLKPLPQKAKEVLMLRSVPTSGELSGSEVLGSLSFAADDPDILEILLKTAEGRDPNEQFAATQALLMINPLPPASIDVFRRLDRRTDLDESVRANVTTAIKRIEY